MMHTQISEGATTNPSFVLLRSCFLLDHGLGQGTEGFTLQGLPNGHRHPNALSMRLAKLNPECVECHCQKEEHMKERRGLITVPAFKWYCLALNSNKTVSKNSLWAFQGGRLEHVLEREYRCGQVQFYFVCRILRFHVFLGYLGRHPFADRLAAPFSCGQIRMN